ncbi:MAG TPA: hypothetical protein VGB07_36385 [Blastocatellia bacterium]
MPESSPFLTVEYSFPNSKLQPAEQQKQIALQAISDMKGLFKLMTNLTSTRIVEEIADIDDGKINVWRRAEISRRVEVFDSGINVLGQVGAAIGDTAYFAVEEMFTTLTEAPKGKARSKGGAQ